MNMSDGLTDLISVIMLSFSVQGTGCYCCCFYYIMVFMSSWKKCSSSLKAFCGAGGRAVSEQGHIAKFNYYNVI